MLRILVLRFFLACRDWIQLLPFIWTDRNTLYNIVICWTFLDIRYQFNTYGIVDGGQGTGNTGKGQRPRFTRNGTDWKYLIFYVTDNCPNCLEMCEVICIYLIWISLFDCWVSMISHLACAVIVWYTTPNILFNILGYVSTSQVQS